MSTKAAEKNPYPALRAFMHGYLHEDYAEEYGTAVDAVREFRFDSDDEEFKAVVAEWKRFMHQMKTMPIRTVQKIIRQELGAGWMPSSHADLEMLNEAFTHPKAAPQE